MGELMFTNFRALCARAKMAAIKRKGICNHVHLSGYIWLRQKLNDYRNIAEVGRIPVDLLHGEAADAANQLQVLV